MTTKASQATTPLSAIVISSQLRTDTSMTQPLVVLKGFIPVYVGVKSICVAGFDFVRLFQLMQNIEIKKCLLMEYKKQ